MTIKMTNLDKDIYKQLNEIYLVMKTSLIYTVYSSSASTLR